MILSVVLKITPSHEEVYKSDDDETTSLSFCIQFFLNSAHFTSTPYLIVSLPHTELHTCSATLFQTYPFTINFLSKSGVSILNFLNSICYLEKYDVLGNVNQSMCINEYRKTGHV